MSRLCLICDTPVINDHYITVTSFMTETKPFVNFICSLICVQDFIQLIEKLESACIRFVHFSKENELRSRVSIFLISMAIEDYDL